MIDFGLFQYAAAPRTGTTWMAGAMFEAVGIRTYKTYVHTPGEADYLSVTSIRHPLNWLVSYWREIHPGSIYVQEVDQFHKQQLSTISFADFIRDYLDKMPGQVGRIFDSYQADTCLRLEDYPYNLIELLASLGVPMFKARKVLNVRPRNFSHTPCPVWPRALLQAVLDAERDCIERYDYELRDLHPSTISVASSA